jgi:hypothetical protein
MAESPEQEKQIRGIQECDQCARKFISRNKLFAPLRTTNHFCFSAEVHSKDAQEGRTPNNLEKERSTQVIKSKGEMVPGTG